MLKHFHNRKNFLFVEDVLANSFFLVYNLWDLNNRINHLEV